MCKIRVQGGFLQSRSHIIHTFIKYIATKYSFNINVCTYVRTHIDPPSVTIREDKMCTTSVTISLIIDSHQSCGNVLCNVTISGNVINSDTDDSFKYIIGELESNTAYNITVTYTYNNGSLEEFDGSVKTTLPKCKQKIVQNKSTTLLRCNFTIEREL